jgi:hypothetical protein
MEIFMSIETELQNVVAAASALNQTVRGQVDAIDLRMLQMDQRVDQKRNELDAWRSGYRTEDAVGITVYVAATGNDANDGLTSASPVATLSRAMSLLPRAGRIDMLSDLTLTGAGADCGNRDIDLFLNGHTLRFSPTPVTDSAGIVVGTGFARIANWRRLVMYSGSVIVDPIASSGNGNPWFYRISRSPLVAGGNVRFAALGFMGCNIDIGDNAVGASGAWHANEPYGLVSGYSVVGRMDTSTTLGTGATFAEFFDVERGFAHDGTL